MGINATLNVTKCISYKIKLAQLQALHNDALSRKARLNSEIEGYESHKQYIAFARNYLGYAAPDEIKIVLVEDKNPHQPKRYGMYH